MQADGTEWWRAHMRLIVYALGAGMVSVWTLLRFFTQRTIFDLVSQQVIVHQWLHSAVSTAHMGQTAYVPKMLLLYAPLDLMPGSPRFKLIVLTLLLNVATFVLIGRLLERLLRHYGVRVGWTFYAALLWLSVLAGSVFWIEFANSRNVEVAGGLLLLLLGVQYLEHANRKLMLCLAAFGGVLFYGDPLQVYMTAVPLMVYATSLAVTHRTDRRRVVMLSALLVAGWAISKLLFAATGNWLHLTFTGTGAVGTPDFSAAWLKQSAVGTVKAIISLVAGASDAGRLREIANLALFVLGAMAVLYSIRRRWLPRRLLLLVVCTGGADTLIYIASGQAVQGAATSRYLIMLAPVVALVFSATRVSKAAFKPAVAAVGILVTLNIVALVGALGMHWNTAFPADGHIASMYRYIQQHPDTHVYASADTAMAALYLQNLPAGKALPVGCLDSRLVQTHFSMDQAFAANTADAQAGAAIVFDSNTISNIPNVCTVASVQAQFGNPVSVDYLDDGSTVLRYPQTRVRLAD